MLLTTSVVLQDLSNLVPTAPSALETDGFIVRQVHSLLVPLSLPQTCVVTLQELLTIQPVQLDIKLMDRLPWELLAITLFRLLISNFFLAHS